MISGLILTFDLLSLICAKPHNPREKPAVYYHFNHLKKSADYCIIIAVNEAK